MHLCGISAGCILTVKKTYWGPFPCFDYDLSACADRCTPIAVFGLFLEGQRSKRLIPGFQAAEASKFRLSKCLFLQHVWARMRVLGSSVDLQLAPTRNPQPKGFYVFCRKKWTSIPPKMRQVSQNATNSDKIAINTSLRRAKAPLGTVFFFF